MGNERVGGCGYPGTSCVCQAPAEALKVAAADLECLQGGGGMIQRIWMMSQEASLPVTSVFFMLLATEGKSSLQVIWH
jgi:Na+-translocating ferredoxin:NAD+ oxidoreductase RNF subunit RnfB